MMNTWDNYVSLTMAKELFVEAGEADEQVNSQHFMNKNAQYLMSLLCTPCFNYGEDDLDLEEDVSNRGISRHLIRLLASRPVCNELKHYSGIVNGPIGSVCKAFNVDVDGITHRISVDSETKFQKYFFSENEGIHIYAEKNADNIIARYIINEDAYQAALRFKGPDFDAHLVGEYLRLTSEEQTAFSLLAVNQNIRRSVLYALSYLATHTIAMQTYSADELYTAMEHFNTHIQSKYGCLELKPDFVSVCARYLFDSKPVDLSMNLLSRTLQVNHAVTIPNKLLPFAIFAIMNGFSIWHEQGLSTTQIIIEKLATSNRRYIVDAICTTTHPKLANAVLSEIAEECGKYPQYESAVSNMLFKVLIECKRLEDDTLRRICDFMFRRTIYRDQAQHIGKVLNGPNGIAFRNYIMDSYRKGYENGNAEYHFCAAAIANADRRSSNFNPLVYAITHITEDEPNAEWLLNVMCLGVLAWHGRVERSLYSVKSLSLDDSVVDRLISFLSTPDKLFFPIVSCTIHDLVLNDVLPFGVLGESERLAALQLLGHEVYRKRAEELLALIPAPYGNISCAVNSDLVTKYTQRYEACQNDPKSEDDCEVLLAVLFHLGAFPTLAERQEQIYRVVHRSIGSRVFNDDSNKWRIGNLLHTYGLGSYLWTKYSTQADPATLDQELSESKKAELIQLGKKLDAEDQVYTVTETQEGLDIIKFITPYIYEIPTQRLPEPKNLGAHIIMDIPNPGSYIILKWFDILCRYAPGERALAYYRAYQEVLDRPANILRRSLAGGCRGFYEAYTALKRDKPRVLEGLHNAVESGNYSVLSAFMSSEFRHLIDNQKFVDSFINDLSTFGAEKKLFSIYEGRYGTDIALKRVHAATRASTDEIQRILDKIDRLIDEQTENETLAESPSEQDRIRKGAILSNLSQPSEDLLVETPVVAIKRELEYSPTTYYDDRTVQAYALIKKPHQSHLVMHTGFADDRDMVKLAITVNGENLQYASHQFRMDEEICYAALQQTGLALPYVRSAIRNKAEIIKPLLLSSECVLHGIPLQYCNDPDIVLHAIQRDHSQLQYASDALRANREIAAAIVCQPHKDKTVPAAVKWISDALKDDTELMIRAVKANPQAYTYISPRLKRHPAILALPHEDKPMDTDDIVSKIQKMINNL